MNCMMVEGVVVEGSDSDVGCGVREVKSAIWEEIDVWKNGSECEEH